MWYKYHHDINIYNMIHILHTIDFWFCAALDVHFSTSIGAWLIDFSVGVIGGHISILFFEGFPPCWLINGKKINNKYNKYILKMV